MKLSQAKRAKSLQVKALRTPESRGCLTRHGRDHFENRILEPGVARMSQAKRARSPQVRTSRTAEFPGCLARDGREHFEDCRVPRMSHAKRARTRREPNAASQSCADVLGEAGQRTKSPQIIRLPSMSHAKRARTHFKGHILEPRVVRMSQAKRAR